MRGTEGLEIKELESALEGVLFAAGEPVPVEIAGDIDAFTETVWNSLDTDNRVSLFTRFIDLKTGGTKTRIVNKHEG